MKQTNAKLDVIIVGAGLAGLRAALELKEARKRVVVLEARDRVGGRSMPGEICGQTIDLGGQWVGPQQRLLLEQAKNLNVETPVSNSLVLAVEQSSRGCYVAHTAPGTETATEWTGYLDGALQSGIQAAKEVLSAAGQDEQL